MIDYNDERHMRNYLEYLSDEHECSLPSNSILEKLNRKNINRLLECLLIDGSNEIVCLKFAKILIEKYGADPKSKFYENSTALHLAAARDFVSVFFYLLPYSDIYAKDVFGNTAFDIVEQYNIASLKGCGYLSDIGLHLVKNNILNNIPAAATIKSSRIIPEIKTKIIKNLFGGRSPINKYIQPKYKKCGFGMDYSVPGVLGGLGGSYVQPNMEFGSKSEFGKVMKWAKKT